MSEDEFLIAWKLVFGYRTVEHAEAIKFKYDCGFGNRTAFLTGLVDKDCIYRDVSCDVWQLINKESNDETSKVVAG